MQPAAAGGDGWHGGKSDLQIPHTIMRQGGDGMADHRVSPLAPRASSASLPADRRRALGRRRDRRALQGPARRAAGRVRAGHDVAGLSSPSRNRVRRRSTGARHSSEASGKARAVLVNAGNANAFTGKAGVQTVAARSPGAAAQRVRHASRRRVFVASTGVIGEPLIRRRSMRCSPGSSRRPRGDAGPTRRGRS